MSGLKIISERRDGNITVWDTQSRSIVTQWNTEYPVWSLLSLKKNKIISEEEDYLCSGHYDGMINVWNSKGECVRQLKGHTNEVRSLVMQGEHLISACWDNTLRKWDLNTGQCLQILKGHTGSVNCVIESHGILFSGSNDKTIRVWNQSGQCIQTIQADSQVYSLKIFDGRLYCGCEDGSLYSWPGKKEKKNDFDCAFKKNIQS